MLMLQEFHNPADISLEDIATKASMPVVIRQAIANWPVVNAAKHSSQALFSYLQTFDNGRKVQTFFIPQSENGRVFYNSEFDGMNFSRQTLPFSEFLLSLSNQLEDTFYMGSTNVGAHFPGFREANDLHFGVDDKDKVVNFWMGNQSVVAAHSDYPDNFACCLAGRRKFTLFPPEQVENLYIGPWDFNPAGPAISLVDPDNPDYDKYPRYVDALANAFEVTLEPGDVLYVPSMWWHQVKGLDDVNLLMNYWWKKTPQFIPSPLHAMNLALLTIKQLPAEQKQAWQSMFEHYIFSENSFEHIPEKVKGSLGEMNESTARQMRAQLLNALNR